MRTSSALLAMAAVLTLAACHKRDEEPVPMENNVAEMNNAEEQPQQPVEAPPVLEPEAPTNNSVAPPPPPKVTQDQQTLDDADATGLTSKLPDDYDGSASGNHASAAQ